MEEILYTPILVIHVVACAFLVLVVLLQPGKSGGLGALSGAGAQQVFGGRGAGNILTRITWITAGTFFITSVTLAFLSSSGDESMRKRDVEIGVIEEAPIKVPTAKDKTAEPKKPEQSAEKKGSEPANTKTDSTESKSEPPTDTEPKNEEPKTGPATGATQPTPPSTPAAPLAPKPAAPAPAAPKPAAPAPAAPAPAAPKPAAPKPAAPTPAAPGAPGDSPY